MQIIKIEFRLIQFLRFESPAFWYWLHPILALIKPAFFMVSGAFLGAFLKYKIDEKAKSDKESRLKAYFQDFEGLYSVKRKDNNGTDIQSVELIHNGGTSLKMIFTVRNMGKAQGFLSINDINLKTGTGYYSHVESDLRHLSGFYDVMLIDKGFIHARQNYIKGSDGTNVVYFYIWQRIKDDDFVTVHS